MTFALALGCAVALNWLTLEHAALTYLVVYVSTILNNIVVSVFSSGD